MDAAWINANVRLVDCVITFPAQDAIWFYNMAKEKLPSLNRHTFISYNEDQDAVGVSCTQKAWMNKLLQEVKEIFFIEMLESE